jgi:DNA-binding CsgD family transcriptional regulator
MEKFVEIVKKRSAPGILIFDMHERLLYANSEVFDIMPTLSKSDTEGGVISGVPGEVLDLYRSVKENPADTNEAGSIDLSSVVMKRGMGDPCSLRAFHIGQHGKTKNPTHIVVLVEKVVEKHEPDFDKAKIKYNLSKKELEVLRLVCLGFNNKSIGEKMFISVFTVKDHMKNLKRKMCASSRSEMISLLK